MARNHWVITRPKRRLILIPELLRIFYSVTAGEPWSGNRNLQLRYEKALRDAEWKAQNISNDGSGARTYAALLFMLGLWYEDAEGVKLTLAGQEIFNDINPVKVLTKQLFDFQYPSAYSKNSNVDVSDEFHLQPYRFILNLFLKKGFSEISQDEVGYCLAPFAKKNSDLDYCSEIIHQFRKDSSSIKQLAKISSGTTLDNLKNIGNTAVNQFLISGFFIEGDEIKSLVITDEGRKTSKAFLESCRKTMIIYDGNAPQFQRRYGTGLQKTKDYSSSKRKKMLISPTEKKILEQFYIISSKQPIYSISDELINQICFSTGASVNEIRKVLAFIKLAPNISNFDVTYINLSIGGPEFAVEFEKKTATLFSMGLNIDAEWVGSKSRHPDVFIFLDHVNHKHGIIDTKAYKTYNLPLDHKTKMAKIYIPDFQYLTFNDMNYKLAFFGYVAGGFSSNIQNSFNELLSWVNVPGHYVTASTFLDLLRYHRSSPFSVADFTSLFTINKEITSNDFVSL